jgi:hypothetical protein
MFHHSGSVKISGDGTEGVGVTRKRSGIEDCLCWLLCAGFLALLALATPSGAVGECDSTGSVEACEATSAPAAGIFDEYDAKEAGHPVRIAAYVLHPVGVFIDWVIFRPAWWIGSHEPFYTLFGRTD